MVIEMNEGGSDFIVIGILTSVVECKMFGIFSNFAFLSTFLYETELTQF